MYGKRIGIIGAIMALGVSAFGQLTVGGYSQVSATLATNGTWSISIPGSGWRFGGSVGSSVSAATINTGVDDQGAYQELAFLYSVSTNSRNASIRVYAGSPAVLFSVTYNGVSPNISPFPVIAAYPAIPHLSFDGEFSAPDFTNLHADSPWVAFDAAANTFILSPASNYMTSGTIVQTDKSITNGISSKIATLPAGFTHRPFSFSVRASTRHSSTGAGR